MLPIREKSPLARFSLLSVNSMAHGDCWGKRIERSPSLHGYCTLRSKGVLPFGHTEPMEGEDPHLETKSAPREVSDRMTGESRRYPVNLDSKVRKSALPELNGGQVDLQSTALPG